MLKLGEINPQKRLMSKQDRRGFSLSLFFFFIFRSNIGEKFPTTLLKISREISFRLEGKVSKKTSFF